MLIQLVGIGASHSTRHWFDYQESVKAVRLANVLDRSGNRSGLFRRNRSSKVLRLFQLNQVLDCRG